MMKFEHAAINVPDPVAMADWYVEHVGLQIKAKVDDGAKARWMADAAGVMMFEIYYNSAVDVFDYKSQDPGMLHFAYAVNDAVAESERLIAAGCTLFKDERPAENTILIMLQDPWGVPIQLCQRATPFVEV